MRELTRLLKPRIQKRSAVVCAGVEVFITVHMQGNKSRIHPGNRTSACAAKYKSVYLYSSPKVDELLRGVFFLGGREEIENSATPTRVSKLSSRRVAPPPCCWTGRKHKLHQTAPPKKRFPALCAQRQPWASRRQSNTPPSGLNVRRNVRDSPCRGDEKKKQSWCAAESERPSCAPDYGPFDSREK